MNNTSIRAIAILAGTTIGAGIFAVPYAIAQIGFIPGLLYLLVIGGLMILLNLMYGEIVLRTKGDHQLTGYSQIYFGKKGKMIATLVMLVGLYGALLAYLIQIGVFAYGLLGVGSPLIWSMVFFSMISLAVLKGVRFVAKLETLLLGGLLLLLLMLLGGSLVRLNLDNFTGFNPVNIFLPFGVLLFALTGATVIPEVEELMRRQHSRLKQVIFIGSFIPLVVYFLFAFAVVGVSGLGTSQDAITGLAGLLPQGIVAGGALLGIVTMGGSFLTLAYILREVWYRDYHCNRFTSWSLAVFPPLLLFFVGFASFFQVLQITGALTGGMTGILIGSLYLKALKSKDWTSAYSLKLPKVVVLVIILVFALGVFTGF
ncbi:hypothetical protein GW940_04230 [Candidatus Microgenomates bacterium]|nr:hypothetical protein [Candidatus Microgenomates bacterium]